MIFPDTFVKSDVYHFLGFIDLLKLIPVVVRQN